MKMPRGSLVQYPCKTVRLVNVQRQFSKKTVQKGKKMELKGKVK